MSITHSVLLMATISLIKPALSGCNFQNHGLGSFLEDKFKCQNSKFVLGSYCQKPTTYTRDNCDIGKTRWWDEPQCDSGDDTIKSENNCGPWTWPRQTKTCQKKKIADYGCGCGKTPWSCGCQCDNTFRRCPTGFRLEKNTDYRGNDIKCGQKMTVAMAGTKCGNDSRCKGFSLRPDNVGSDGNGRSWVPWCGKHTLANKESRTDHQFCVKDTRRRRQETSQGSEVQNLVPAAMQALQNFLLEDDLDEGRFADEVVKVADEEDEELKNEVGELVKIADEEAEELKLEAGKLADKEKEALKREAAAIALIAEEQMEKLKAGRNATPPRPPAPAMEAEPATAPLPADAPLPGTAPAPMETEPEVPATAGSAQMDHGTAPLPGDAPVPLAETISHLENFEQFCAFAAKEGMQGASCSTINAMLSRYLADGMLDVCNGTDMTIGDVCK